MRLDRVHAFDWKAASLAAGALAFALLSASCSSDNVTLTRAEAIRVIRAGFGYPRLATYTFGNVSPSSPFGREIDRLLREGYLRAEYEFVKHQQLADLKPTEKGKELVAFCRYDPGITFTITGPGPASPRYTFRPYTHLLDVDSVDEVLVDSPSRTAVVRFNFKASPTEYFKRLSDLDSVRANEVRLPTHGTARLKRWDQGWRIEEKK